MVAAWHVTFFSRSGKKHYHGTTYIGTCPAGELSNMCIVLWSTGGAGADGGGAELAAEREEPGAARDDAAEEHRDRESGRRAVADGAEVRRPGTQVPDPGRDGRGEPEGDNQHQGRAMCGSYYSGKMSCYLFSVGATSVCRDVQY